MFYFVILGKNNIIIYYFIGVYTLDDQLLVKKSKNFHEPLLQIRGSIRVIRGLIRAIRPNSCNSWTNSWIKIFCLTVI
jgi:hypothetical protein